jgi:hypothetical protein
VKKGTAQNGGAWSSAAASRLRKIAGDPSRIEDAVQIVVGRFLDSLDCPPTDLNALGARLNVTRIIYEDLPFSGELRRNSKGFEIACSSHLSASRQRFTVAHELAHVIFETTGPNCPTRGKELERLCDMMASEILMPQDKFMTFADADLRIDRLFELSKTFKTSLAATAIRCAQLFGQSVFEVQGALVTWGYGAIKKGPISRLDEYLRRAVEKALQGKNGEETLVVHTGRLRKWNVQYRPLAKEGRALFLMKIQSSEAPASSSSQQVNLNF